MRDGADRTEPVPAAGLRRPLQRIAAVRRQQGVSRRGAARQLRISVEELKRQESESADLLLSQVYAWQEVLEVPVADLLVEPTAPLSPPVLARARLVRVMKTVAAILETAQSAATRRLAQTLVDQLIELMPELDGVGPWHLIGQRRSLGELGRTAEQTFPDRVWVER